jgi:hypothetical protein
LLVGRHGGGGVSSVRALAGELESVLV